MKFPNITKPPNVFKSGKTKIGKERKYETKWHVDCISV